MLVVLLPEHDTLHSRFAGHVTPPSPLPPAPDEPGMEKLVGPPGPLPLLPSPLCELPHAATLVMAATSNVNAIGPRVDRRMTTSLAGTTKKRDPKVQTPQRRPRDGR